MSELATAGVNNGLRAALERKRLAPSMAAEAALKEV
jgi:hypothetical protein